MKTVKQIREEYDVKFLSQVEVLPEEIMLEGIKPVPTSSPVPSAKEMPIMLVFRRIQYRIFPNRQVVALYYSKMINKYLSIPFGPDGNVNLSEATIVEPEMLDEDWQSVNRKDKTDGLSQAAVNAYRRENPGSKLKTAVTEKNPKGKRAARRKSFCSRMGGMKKRLTSAKTARDPNSRINKALRRWNCEESFRAKLQEKRMYKEGALSDFALDVAPVTGTIRSAQRTKDAYKKGEYGRAAFEGGMTALGAAGDLALATGIGAGAGGVIKGGVGALRAGTKFAKGLLGGAAKKSVPRAMEKSLFTGAKTTGAKAIGNVGKSVAGKVVGQTAKKSVLKGLAGAAGAAAKGLLDPLEGSKPLGQNKAAQANIKKGTVTPKATEVTPSMSSKMRQAELSKTKIHENKISDIRKALEEDVKLLNLSINGRTVTLNNSMAKRIVEVYDSVNTKNKKIVEGMLNEDLESFKRLLNFSIKV